MVVDRVSLQGRPGGIGAGPNHNLRTSVCKALPNFGEIDVKTGGKSQHSEIGAVDLRLIAHVGGGMNVILRPIRKNFVVCADYRAAAIQKYHGIKPAAVL